MRVILLTTLCINLLYGPKNTESKSQKTQKYIKSGFQIEIRGCQNHDPKRILDMVSEHIKSSDQDIRNILLRTDLFKEVKVNRTNQILKIEVTEYPLLNKIQVKSGFLPPVPVDEVMKRANLEKRSPVSDQKIKRCIETLRGIYQFMTDQPHINVKVFTKKTGSFIDLEFEVSSHAYEPIAGIKFIGNHSLSKRELNSAVYQKALGLYPLPVIQRNVISKQDFDMHKSRLEEFAKSRGFLDFEVNSISIDYINNRPYIIIHVTEGNQYRINKIKFNNRSKSLSNKEVQNTVSAISISRPYNSAKCNIILLRLASKLYNLNIYDQEAAFTLKKDPDKKLVDITFNIGRANSVFKVRKVIIKQNHRTNDSVILSAFRIQPGDLISLDALTYQKRLLMDLNLFSEVNIDTVKTKNTNEIDVVIEVTEAKTIQAMANAGTAGGGGISLSASETNLKGTGVQISFDGFLSKEPNINLKLCKNNIINNIDLFIKVGHGRRFLNGSSAFEASSFMDTLKDWLFSHDYKNVAQLSKDFQSYKHFFDARELKEKKLIQPLSYLWTDGKGSRSISEIHTSFDIGLECKMGNAIIVPSLGFAHRDILFDQKFDESSYKKTHTTDESDFLQQIRGQGRLPTLHRMPRFIINEDNSYLSVSAPHELYNVRNLARYKTHQLHYGGKIIQFNTTNGNIVIPENEITNLDRINFRNKDSVVYLVHNTGRNPLLDQSIKEKFEFKPNIAYILNHLILEYDIKLMLKMDFGLTIGTTYAANYKIRAGLTKNLMDIFEISASIMYGQTFNQSYLDNFNPSDLGLCHFIGPVELYDYSSLGGKKMFKAGVGLSYNMYDSPSIGLKPFIRLEFGSLWDSGIPQAKLSEELAMRRQWPKSIGCIGQDKFSLVGVCKFGLSFKMGPVVLSPSINVKILDEGKANIVKPIDFNIGLAV